MGLSLEKERERVAGLRAFDLAYASCGRLAGIDEAGRGPLAGPVVAAAVIPDPAAEILYVNDSKKLSEKRREMLYPEITEKCLAFGIGIVPPERIDAINILQATYEAMRAAVAQLCPAPDLLLNDAVTIPGIPFRQIPVIKGDAKSFAIAAASILAKVTRDRIMLELDSRYPGYGFAAHKGYGTAAHIEALRRLGPSPVHRRTFIKNFF